MFKYLYEIKSEEYANELITNFEKKCLKVKKSFISLFNGGRTDIPEHIIKNLLEISSGVDAINNWLSELEEKHKEFSKEIEPVLDESNLLNLCHEVSSMYGAIENDVIEGTNLRNLELSEECKKAGEKSIDIFCTDYPFELSFDDYFYNMTE